MHKGKAHREASPNQRLKNERQLRGWSQGQLAAHLDVPDYYISRWERGEVWPSPYYQQKLCALFGKTAHELGLIPASSRPAAPPEAHPAQPASTPGHSPLLPWWQRTRTGRLASSALLLALVLALGGGAASLSRTIQHVPSVAAPSLLGKHKPAPTPTIQGQATPRPTQEVVHQRIVDDLNDWSNTYSHSANLAFDTNNSQWMHGDTSLLYRLTNTPEAVVWKLQGMTFFQALTYFWPPDSDAPRSDLGVYTSADGVHWTAATPVLSGGTGNWIEYTYTLNHVSHVNFVQMRWSVTTNPEWTSQIGQVTLRS